jgi:hypothetical protein
MSRPFSLFRASAVAALSLIATPALALDCDQVMSMLNAGVPAEITIQTMRNSGKAYSPDEVKCLAEAGAPADVVNTARSLRAVEDPVVGPSTASPADPLSGGDGGFPTLPGSINDIPEEGDDGGTDPRLVKECIQIYRSGKALTSSKCFFDMLESDEFPDQRSKLFYYMAKSLDDLSLYHGAQHYYMEVVRRGLQVRLAPPCRHRRVHQQ